MATDPGPRLPRWAAVALMTGLTAGAVARAGEAISYRGACDASAAVALDGTHFIVGNDENSVLAVYRLDQAASVATVTLSSFLGLGRRDEADIEGAAAIGTRIYWISSHARDSKGRAQPGRHRLFATDIVPGSPPTVAPAGTPYRRLLEDLLAAPQLAAYPIADASRRAAEAEGGLNIEGLAATPDGRLLIGLRNPVPRGRALLIALDNPDEVIARGRPARLGGVIELELGGRGIRSIERVGEAYFIAAGTTGDAGSFAIYRWSGRAQDAPAPLPGIALGDLRPEALFALPGSGKLMVLSDDGGVRRGALTCKQLPPQQQAFRGMAFRP
jgi:Protein of unknown function (DUF3616)